MTRPTDKRWSSQLAFYVGAVGVAVGLGSIWRFPYLAGVHGGSVFVFAFVLACLLIAAPLLVAEFMIGRRSRMSPPQAAGELAAAAGLSTRWNSIGWLGTVAVLIIGGYYIVIAGWVLAYTWKCAVGTVTNSATPAEAAALFDAFRADPLEMGAWHLAFLCLVAWISARGLARGIEVVNLLRAPALLVLLLILTGYALYTGDVERGLHFAFAPDFSKLSAEVMLAAIGQAFFATGVGMAVMIAYGAYVGRDVSLVHSALVTTGSIVVVSLLATLMVFPLVYGYGMNPAQGSELVFHVLPAAFAEMPAGRLIGTLFFLLLVFAALTPSIAVLEPSVAWAEQRFQVSRGRAVIIVTAVTWLLGIGSVLSFNYWADWKPLSWIALLSDQTFFGVSDYIASNVLLPFGALLTSLFIGWRLDWGIAEDELAVERRGVRVAIRFLLRWVCPFAIAAVMATSIA
ncbi:MAG TPA: sodium-dependent transporter [Steroidobacteraceae bacterium]|nr:sodium-dependent transporter [Steroidobacteraceae bacterium]